MTDKNKDSADVMRETGLLAENSDSSEDEKNSVHSSDDEVDPIDNCDSVEAVREYLASKLGINPENLKHSEDEQISQKPLILESFDLDGIVKYIEKNKVKNKLQNNPFYCRNFDFSRILIQFWTLTIF